MANIIQFGLGMNCAIYRPDWLKKQRGLVYAKTSRAVYWGKFRIVRTISDELRKKGLRVTHDQIREMLDYLQRGYTTDPQTISRLLHGVSHKSDRKHKYPNGHRVEVKYDGGVKFYTSLNSAAEGEKCSAESVRLWAATEQPNRRGQIWRFVDPASGRKKPRRR